MLSLYNKQVILIIEKWMLSLAIALIKRWSPEASFPTWLLTYKQNNWHIKTSVRDATQDTEAIDK